MIRILLIDDSPNDRLLANRELRRAFPDVQIKEIVDVQQFGLVLEVGNFDLLITDYQLLWSDGLAVLRAVKSRYPDCLAIMFTNSGNEEIAVEGMKLGLNDYVLKDKRIERLSRAVAESLEKQQIRQQLKVAEERFRLALKAARMVSWDWNASTNDIIWSEGGEQLFDLPPGGLAGTYDAFLALVHPGDRELIVQASRNALKTGADFVVEYRVLLADGTVCWIASRGRLILDNAAQPLRMIGVALDITDRKQSELALQEHAEKLAEANRLKDEFLAVISHELRTPLNAILGWSHILKNHDFNVATQKRYLDTIERNAKRQQQLIEDLLDMSRLMRGQMQLKIAPVNLISVIENAINTVWLSAEAKSICLKLDLDRTIEFILGDENRLHQIIWNLLSNAIKFTPQGGKITVRLDRADEQVRIQVSDTGKGISADFLPHIFERFRQADASKTRSYTGLGLGLAIVRQLVELHGGQIQADSPGEGQGTTFTVLLPSFKENGSTQTEGLPLFSASLALSSLTGMKILVVDDDIDSRELVAIIFEQYEAVVMTVASAREALDVFKQFQPDLLIADIGMPTEDGYSLMRKIRTLPPQKGGEIPAIALTAYARLEDRTDAFAAGFQRHLTKPIDPEQLVAIAIKLWQGVKVE
ncbi:response regulator [Chlorogloeopsis sp. ULAP02]|uniref:hybrid sensor histidine kinase/response regulator n=1 Tax=Chlorogloeopsis sp. ULAP02 TaxID=3107926 RepID=UPI0031367207